MTGFHPVPVLVRFPPSFNNNEFTLRIYEGSETKREHRLA